MYKSLGLFNKDLILVDKGAKPAATIGSTRNIDRILERKGIYYQRTDPDEGKATYTYDITRRPKYHRRFGKIREPLTEKELEEVGEEGQGFKEFGRMYGYPKCCAERYERDFERRINPGQRYQQQLHGRSEPKELRHIQHVPCSPNCERSKALGRRYAKALGEQIEARHGFHGIVRQPTRFLVGEAGPERVNVTPLRNNRIQHVRMNSFKVNIGISGMRKTPSIFGKGSLGKLARF